MDFTKNAEKDTQLHYIKSLNNYLMFYQLLLVLKIKYFVYMVVLVHN